MLERESQIDDKVAKHSALSSNDIDVIIVSGRSGSGKTSVLNILEDLGYYAIDNMPLSLVPQAVIKLIEDGGITKLALGVDIRTLQADCSNFSHIQDGLRHSYGHNSVRVLYVTAQESVLIARFAATRRVHPLMTGSTNLTSNLPNAIRKEVGTLQPISSNADIVIDTSQLNIHQLKDRVREYVGVENEITINLLSFGFKYGLPIDSDFVFDVRILPNPHWHTELRSKTGRDDEVVQFFSDYPEVTEMQQDIQQFLERWLPNFLDNNRHTVTVAIGCTGGKHRSVYIAEQLNHALNKHLPKQLKVIVKHREKSRWQA